jgi:hypothetical protein
MDTLFLEKGLSVLSACLAVVLYLVCVEFKMSHLLLLSLYHRCPGRVSLGLRECMHASVGVTMAIAIASAAAVAFVFSCSQ